MEKMDVNELKSKNEELIKKCCAYTNLAYALVEVADSLIMDINTYLKEFGAEVDKREKAKLKNIIAQGKRFKVWTADFASKIYKISSVDEALNDADTLYDLMLLILDRCGGDMDTLSHIRAMIFNSFKSKYGYYNKK